MVLREELEKASVGNKGRRSAVVASMWLWSALVLMACAVIRFGATAMSGAMAALLVSTFAFLVVPIFLWAAIGYLRAAARADAADWALALFERLDRLERKEQRIDES